MVKVFVQTFRARKRDSLPEIFPASDASRVSILGCAKGAVMKSDMTDPISGGQLFARVWMTKVFRC
jgi:hypothetical protein